MLDALPPGTIVGGQGMWHYNITPPVVHSELSRSLERLGVSKIDSYLVHNPEMVLLHAAEQAAGSGEVAASNGNEEEEKQRVSDAREQLLSEGGALEGAFAALEEEVGAGRIGRYGVSSNSFALDSSHAHFLPVSELPAIAARAAARVHGPGAAASLGVVQLPGNLLERTALRASGAALEAHALGLNVMVNRPLNAFDEQGSWRLADAPFPPKYAEARDRLVSRLTPF